MISVRRRRVDTHGLATVLVGLLFALVAIVSGAAPAVAEQYAASETARFATAYDAFGQHPPTQLLAKPEPINVCSVP